MPDAIAKEPYGPFLAIIAPNGFAWSARAPIAEGRTPPPIVAEGAVEIGTIGRILRSGGEIEIIPVVEGLTFQVFAPKSVRR